MEYAIDHDEQASVGLVRLISSMKGVKPEALDPLHEVVDSDALDTLASSVRDRSGASHVTIQFDYEGYHVCIKAGEHIVIDPSNGNCSQGRSCPK